MILKIGTLRRVTRTRLFDVTLASSLTSFERIQILTQLKTFYQTTAPQHLSRSPGITEPVV